MEVLKRSKIIQLELYEPWKASNLHLPVLRRASGLKGRHRGVGELAFARKQVEVEIAEKLVRIPVLNFELNKQVFHLKLEFEFFKTQCLRAET